MVTQMKKETDGVSFLMKRQGTLGRLITWAVLAALMLALLPAAVMAESQYGYIVINNDTKDRVVYFRPNANKSNYIARLPEGLVMEVLGLTTDRNGTVWYHVGRLADGRQGYIHGDFFHEMTAEETLAWQTAGGDYFPTYQTAIPTPAPTTPPAAPETGKGYVRLVKGSVNIRKTPSGTVLTGPMASKMPFGIVLEYFEGPTDKINGYNWVKISYNGITGYVRSDCYVYCDQQGTEIAPPAVVPTQAPVPTAAPIPGNERGTLTTIKGGLNYRVTPGGKILYRLDKNITLPFFSTEYAENHTWYYVYDAVTGKYGYLMDDFVQVNSDNGSIGATPTQAPVSTGYVATSMDYVWLRNAPMTTGGTVTKIAKEGTVLIQTGAMVKDPERNLHWYPVMTADGTRGYVRSDCAFALAPWQVEYYAQYGVCPTPTPAPATPRPGNSDYIITTANDLWVRTSPSKKAAVLNGNTQLDANYVTQYHAKEKVSGVYWYKIMIGNQAGWVHGNYVRVLTNAEYDAWQGAQPTPTPTPTPKPMADPSTFSDMALTTDEKVKMRNQPKMDGKQLTVVYAKGSKLTYLGNYTTPTTENPYYWFNVKYGNLSGWMRGDFVRVLTVDEKRMYEMAGNPDAPPEASYRTLSLGATGEDVQALQNKLVEEGYLDASQATGTYLTSTKEAVEAYQKDHGLTVDGVAGEKTQHMLFNTVPEGTYTGSTVTPVLYPVEKVDWFKGDIKQLWSPGTVAILTDVKTGISLRAQCLYGDNHADAEPLTKEDTAAMCRIYGVSNPQEIEEREPELQSYRRRPMWVTVGGRTICGSMYGIPHGYPAGDRIPDNGYNGQFCIHFTNSMTHGTKDNPAHVDYDSKKNGYYGHQSAIEDAYKQSISGWKE